MVLCTFVSHTLSVSYSVNMPQHVGVSPGEGSEGVLSLEWTVTGSLRGMVDNIVLATTSKKLF